MHSSFPVSAIARPRAAGLARSARLLAAAWLVALLVACGSGSGPSEPSGPPPTQAEAARFLAQASFGATEADINIVANVYSCFGSGTDYSNNRGIQWKSILGSNGRSG